MIHRSISIFIVFISVSVAQLKTVSIEEIPIPSTEVWNAPVFSPDGKSVFVTNSTYDGIWQFSLESKTLKEITRDRRSGFGFDLSHDGQQIAFRRTVREGDHVTRIQESVSRNLSTGATTVIERGNSVLTPVFIGVTAVSKKGQMQKLSGNAIRTVLGIEDTKISMVINGQHLLFDPLNGQYIWPRLSPNAERLVAVEMDRGTFVYSFNDEKVRMIGKCNSPTWSYDGKWIIGMDDRDDGHTIQLSDIIAVSPDGSMRILLTESFNAIALYPSASPVDNKVIFNTAEGKVFILTFEEVK